MQNLKMNFDEVDAQMMLDALRKGTDPLKGADIIVCILHDKGHGLSRESAFGLLKELRTETTAQQFLGLLEERVHLN